MGGIGKSDLAKLYAKNYRSTYDHLLWMDAETGIYESFVYNQTLIQNLSINAEQTPKNKFLEIIQKLNSIQGKGLLILNDLASDEKDILEQLKSLYNWHIILTSRFRCKGNKG